MASGKSDGIGAIVIGGILLLLPMRSQLLSQR